jgi:hypothetical protein
MENKKSPLEREDRQSVFDDMISDVESVEVVDLGSFRDLIRGEKSVNDLEKESSPEDGSDKKDSKDKELGKKPSEKPATDLKSDEVIDSSQRLIVNLPFSKEDKFFLRMAAAKESKSVGRYIADIVLKELKKRRKEVISFINTSLE